MKRLIFLLPLFFALPAFAASPALIQQVPQTMRQQEAPVPANTNPLVSNIMGQLAHCWTAPAVNNIRAMPPVVLNVTLDRSAQASAISLDAKSKAEFAKNLDYRQLVISAILAVKSCTPLKFLAPGDYEKWHFLQLTFDPSLMVEPPPIIQN